MQATKGAVAAREIEAVMTNDEVSVELSLTQGPKQMLRGHVHSKASVSPDECSSPSRKSIHTWLIAGCLRFFTLTQCFDRLA